MKKWASIVLTAFMAVSLLAGCGSKETDSNTTAKGGASSSDKPVELAFWGDWAGEGQKQFETMVDAFNKSQNKIHVKYVLQQDMITKFMTTATSGGESPDLVFWDRWRTSLYAPKNVFHPIDEFMEQDKINKDDFYGEALKELSYDGKLYGLPLTVDARALFYNKKNSGCSRREASDQLG